MLNIYYGGGTAHKEKFIFNRIDPHRKTILIVPDQFSLQAEKDALRLMNRKSLTDLMIVDFSALGHKIVRELEHREPEIIDKYGRHMLLTVLVEELSDQLLTFGSQKGSDAFADHMNTMISELKRYEISPDQLEEVIKTLRRQQESGKAGLAYLILKLEDILRIYRAYEDAIEGLYRDSEDYISYYAERIPRSETVKGADIWIYGFDTFTPKNLMVIGELIKSGDSVSVVLTCDEAVAMGKASEDTEDPKDAPDFHDPVRKLTMNGGEDLFELTGMVMERLEALADEAGSEHERIRIHEERKSIWSHPAEDIREHIVLAQTSDHHSEAEKAAAYIQSLVRDEGYRYRDIAVICNDTEELGEMLSRAMKRIDIPVFADRKRQVLHQPVVSFLLSFLDVIKSGYGGDGPMGMIKSGLLNIDEGEESLIENYVREFCIRYDRWRRPFQYKGKYYTDEELEELDRIRGSLVDICDRARDSMGRRNTAGEKVKGLYDFLRDDFHMEEKIAELVKNQEDAGLLEGAAETAQIWNGICEILEQIRRVIGDRKISNRTLADMIRAGLTSLEIGLVPVTSDALIMGTLQRTRPGQIKALVIAGAEEGLLPLHGQDEGLLTRREMEVLEDMDLELARRAGVAAREEQLAIYRLCSLPTEKLYVSCSRSGKGNTVARPCAMFNALLGLQPEIQGDLGKEDMIETVVGRNMTISYLAGAIRARRRGEKIDSRWPLVRDWYEEKDGQALRRIGRAQDFTNRELALSGELADALYIGDEEKMTASISRLEKFSGCPFAHFIQYGLRAREQALFEVGGREIGDAYHNCIMTYCEELTAEENRPESPGFQNMTREECGRRIRKIMERQSGEYREGLFGSDEDSRFRMERVAEICSDIAWAITQQIRQGNIRSMMFEESFGMGGRLPATEIDIGGKKVRLVGRIDRMDILGDGPEGERSVRIIDYKTGSAEIDVDQIRDGHQLQLAVYMDAAEGSGDMQPAGIFYFKINEFMKEQKAGEEADRDEIAMKMEKEYRLEGIAVNDPAILQDMDEGFIPGDKYESMVVPVKYDPAKEEFAKAKGGTLMSPEEFSQLIKESRKQAEEICRRLYGGEINVMPYSTGKKDRKGKEVTACTYCDYGGICMYENR